MSYTALCLVTDVQAYYPGVTFSAGTHPTDTEVTAWIGRATSIIYGVLSVYYTVPVADTADDYPFLKDLCIEYVKDEVNYILGKNRVGAVQNGTIVPRQANHGSFFGKLNLLQTGEMRLPSLTPTNKYVSYNASNEVEFEGNKMEVLW